MGFSLFGLGKKSDIKASTMVGLTEIGKQKAEKQLSKGAEYAILAPLIEKSPQSVAEIAQEADMNIDELKARIKYLAKSGVVRIMAGEG